MMAAYGRQALLFLFALLLSCSSLPPAAPLVRLRLNGLPAGTDKVTVTVTAGGQTETVDFVPNGTDPLNTMTIGFPQGTTGDVTISIRAYQGMCLVGSGSGMLTLLDDGVREMMLTI